MTSQIRETILRQAAHVAELQEQLRERDDAIGRLIGSGDITARWLDLLTPGHWSITDWDSLVEEVRGGR